MGETQSGNLGGVTAGRPLLVDIAGEVE